MPSFDRLEDWLAHCERLHPKTIDLTLDRVHTLRERLGLRFDCAVITSIALDHVDYLGHDREAIGREKAGIMRPAAPVIVSDPAPPASLASEAARIGADLWLAGRDFGHGGDRQQWAWHGRHQRYAGLAYPALRGVNQLINASGVLATFEALRGRLPIT